MVGRTLPNLGLKGFYDLGDSGWGSEMSLNLLKLSVLTQGGVLGRIDPLPGAPADGDVYIVTTAGADENSVAVRDDGIWKYFVPVEGWWLYDRDTNEYISFDGAAWAVFAGGGGGGGIADAPSDGTAYVRKDAAWVPETGGGGSGGPALFHDIFAPPDNTSFTDTNSTQGTIVECLADVTLVGLTGYIRGFTAGVYHAVIYEVNGSTGAIIGAAIDTGPGQSYPFQVDTYRYLPFTAPVALVAGTHYLIAFQRSEGGNSEIIGFGFRNAPVDFQGPWLTVNGSGATGYAHKTMTGGETPTTHRTDAVCYSMGVLLEMPGLSSGGGAGASDLIGTHVCDGTETTITIAVPNTFTDLELSFLGAASAAGEIVLNFNADTTSGNYDHQRLNQYGTPSGAGAIMGNVAASTDYFTGCVMHVPGYNVATAAKSGIGQDAYQDAGALTTEQLSFRWKTHAAITSVTITAPGGGTFATGSVFSVFGKGGSTGGTGGDPSRVLIQEIVLGADAATVDFNAIPQIYKHLELRLEAQSTSADGGSSAPVLIYFNGDSTGGNYERTGFGVYGGGPVGFSSPGGILVSSGNVPEPRGQGMIEIQDYTNTTDDQYWRGRSDLRQTTAGILSCYGSGRWSGDGGITDIQLIPTGYDWKSGGKFSLYALI